jgi:Na+-transporting NADH:ubiquinone oxidoreductase subunit NqrC
MPLKITDLDGQEYVFDDSQSDFVRRLVQENIKLGCQIMELETEVDILQIRLRASEQKNDEIVLATINPLDPERN